MLKLEAAWNILLLDANQPQKFFESRSLALVLCRHE
jgi:hypothetical protein